MNSLIKKAALSGLLLGSLPLLNAAPAVMLGDDASLFVLGSAALEYQSNVARRDTNEISDTALIVSPGVEVKFGGEGSSEAILRAVYEIRQYLDEDDLNGEYARLSFVSLYDTGVLVLKSYAGYNEYGTNAQYMIDIDTDVLVVAERADLTGGVNARYSITEQMGVSAGLDYAERDWRGNGLNGYESIAVPVRLLFAIAPELDAFVGYRHRSVDTDTSLSYTDNYYFAGIEGELFNPLWSVNLDVGLQERDYDGAVAGGSSDGLTFSARINYEADVNRRYYAILSRDYGTSSSNAVSYERTRFTIGGDYRVTEMWSAFFGVTLAESEYERADLLIADARPIPGRKEHIGMARVGISYIPNDYLTVSASYQYIDVNLDNTYSAFIMVDGVSMGIPNPGYSNNVISVSASLRY